MKCSTPGHWDREAQYSIAEDNVSLITCHQCMMVGLNMKAEVRLLNAKGSR